MPMLDKLSQIVVRLERAYSRAQRELERLQQARRQPIQPEKPAPAPQPAAPEPQPAPAPAPYVMSAASITGLPRQESVANVGPAVLPASPLTSGLVEVDHRAAS